MTSRRLPSDGDSSRAAELPGGCSEIGRQLAGERAARQLSVEDVASRLILSKAQVLGLETGRAAAFYNSRYFLRALRKYMAFAGVPEDLLVEPDLEPPAEDPDAPRLTLAGTDAAPAPSVRRIPPRAVAAAGTAILIAILAAGIAWMWPAATETSQVAESTRIPANTALLPAQPLRVAAVAAPSIREAQAAVTGGPADEAMMRVSVGKATWVFVRFPDNRVAEHRLAAGEELEVGPMPVYLVIGTADAVDLRVEDRPVALEPYIRDGQVRITKSQLAALKDAGPSD